MPVELWNFELAFFLFKICKFIWYIVVMRRGGVVFFLMSKVTILNTYLGTNRLSRSNDDYYESFTNDISV